MGAGFSKFMEGVGDKLGKTILESNKPINSIGMMEHGAMVGSSIREQAMERITNAPGLANKFKPLEGGGYSNSDMAMSMLYHQDGSLAKGRIAGGIAGAYMGVSSAGRIASGGGLYKDSDGNTDIMGVPFI